MWSVALAYDVEQRVQCGPHQRDLAHRSRMEVDRAQQMTERPRVARSDLLGEPDRPERRLFIG